MADGGSMPDARRNRILIGVEALSPRARTLAACLFWLCVAGWIAGAWFMTAVPLTGDEVSYAKGASAIADFLMQRGPDAGRTARAVVGAGWFMPGMSLALLPLHLVNAEPSLDLLRIYASVVAFALWLWCLREVSRAFGPWFALALLVFPGLSVTWLFFSSTVWGDLPAGLMLAIVLARSWRLGRAILTEGATGWREVISLELLLAIAIYLRGNLFLAAIAVHVFLIALWVISGRWRALAPGIARLVAGGVLCALLIAPWSVLASRTLGGTVLTTTSVPMSLALAFGDRDRLCFGPCPQHRNIYIMFRNFSLQYGAAHGIGELEAQRKMAAYSLTGLTPRTYLQKVHRNLISFVARPELFIMRFTSVTKRQWIRERKEAIAGFVRQATLVLYVPFFLTLIAANFAVVRNPPDQLTSLGIKMFTLCLFLQPFVHSTHSRYWPTFAPLMGLSAAFVVGVIAHRIRQASAYPEDPPAERWRGGRILTVIQAAYVLFVGALLVAIFAA